MNEKSRPAQAAFSDQLTPNATTAYARPITLSDRAESFLDALAIDLLTGRAELWHLSPALRQLWTFAYEEGRNSRQAEIDNLNWTADRLYTEMCRRPAVKVVDSVPYAELQRIRGDFASPALTPVQIQEASASWNGTVAA